MRLVAWSALFGLIIACSSSTTTPTTPPVEDARADAGADAATTPDASVSTTTSLTVTLNGVVRTLARAQFGTNSDGTLHVESHLGGDAACPTESSPSPMYTLIVTGLPGPTVTSTFLDFQGDVLSGAPLTKSTSVTVTSVQTDATSTSFDVTATFTEGTATGHIFAAHCTSLDE